MSTRLVSRGQAVTLSLKLLEWPIALPLLPLLLLLLRSTKVWEGLLLHAPIASHSKQELLLVAHHIAEDVITYRC